MAKTVSAYSCTECGWKTTKWVGRCAECQQWGTVLETSTKTGLQRQLNVVRPISGSEARPITQLSGESLKHEPTGIGEFDRVLGGGLVAGAAILLSGEPGIGKSTLLLSVAAKVAAQGKKVLYLSAEESINQVRLRAERTGAMIDTLYLASETDLELALGQLEQIDPDLLIVDSVQTVFSPNIEGIAGGPSQVREVASVLTRIAKSRAMPTIMVGHV
ncbi:MAG: AAA family ATPase, partial [Microbacteriaceae bacterium]